MSAERMAAARRLRRLTMKLFDIADVGVKGDGSMDLDGLLNWTAELYRAGRAEQQREDEPAISALQGEVDELQQMFRRRARSDRHRQPVRPTFGGAS